MKKSGSQKGESPSQLIDARIRELGDWRGRGQARHLGILGQISPFVRLRFGLG